VATRTEILYIVSAGRNSNLFAKPVPRPRVYRYCGLDCGRKGYSSGAVAYTFIFHVSESFMPGKKRGGSAPREKTGQQVFAAAGVEL